MEKTILIFDIILCNRGLHCDFNYQLFFTATFKIKKKKNFLQHVQLFSDIELTVLSKSRNNFAYYSVYFSSTS